MNASLACMGGLAAHELLRERGLIVKRLGSQPTPYGDSQPISVCQAQGGAYLFLARYGESDDPVPPRFVNYRANMHALKTMGVQFIVTWNESKAISHNYRVGQFVIVDDLVDETVTPPTSFFETLDLAHVRQWPVFCPALRGRIATALGEEGVQLADRGVYVCVEGHRQETPAEVRKFATFGGDLIGRALAPEAFLAKELELQYASVCYVAQYAESGSSARPFERGQVLDEDVEQQLVAGAVARMPSVMERLVGVLRRNGEIHRVEADQVGGLDRPAPVAKPARMPTDKRVGAIK